MRTLKTFVLGVLLVAAGFAASFAPSFAAVAAQPPMGGGMPDLRTMSGKPLPVAELRPGTVTVRVSRKMPVNAAAGIEVTAIVSAPDGESRKHVAKTGDDGRATFDGLSVGHQFKAEATIDGERLQTADFTIPTQGGTRIMLIAGLAAGGPALPEGAPDEPAEDPFARAAVTGTIEERDGLPRGTLNVELVAPGGKGLPGLEVKLGQVGSDKIIKVHRATSDAQGIAHFSDLPTGEAAGYAALVDHDGMRLATPVFRMSPDKGMHSRIPSLERTNDSSVLRIDNRSVVVIEAREDALAIMQSLVFRNTSEKLFDPGEGGLVLPLPTGFVNAQEISGGVPVEARTREGMAVRAVIAPNSAASFATQARFGFILPADGASDIAYKQPLPTGMESPLIVIPADTGITLQGPGLRRIADTADARGGKVLRYESDAISPGGALIMTVVGLPTRDTSGRKIAGTLALLLLFAALVFARPPKGAAAGDAQALQPLVARREKLFADLVAFEQRSRQQGDARAEPAQERRELVAKLEAVYRQLAGLERREEQPG